jgi:plasmid stabilization system protein ParE
LKTYTIVFAPEAEAQLLSLYRYIEKETDSAEIALRYANAIIEHCEKLQTFPHRGVSREDIRPGLRITHYQSRTVIAYTLEAEQVSIIGFFHGGRDYETALRSEEDD